MLLVLGQLKQFDFISSAPFIGLNFTDTDQQPIMYISQYRANIYAASIIMLI